MRNITLGLTGSVATTLTPKIIDGLRNIQNISKLNVIFTPNAERFLSFDNTFHDFIFSKPNTNIYKEKDEWSWYDVNGRYIGDRSVYKKGDRVLHVELAKNSSCLVIAPASMNTIAKMVHGVCDNLLLSVYNAFDSQCRKVIVAPAMNTFMWNSVQNQQNIKALKERGVIIIDPISKKLACGDEGVGALADISTIVKRVQDVLAWRSPLEDMDKQFLPTGDHPGAFGTVRKHDIHCGVDLYNTKGTKVYSVEPGRIVEIAPYTGKDANSPWWNDTMVIKVEGPTGIISYGEIHPFHHLKVGDILYREQPIGIIIPVLPDNKLRKDIPHHSCSMLHVELHNHGYIHKDMIWSLKEDMPKVLEDCTPFLIESQNKGI